MASQRRAARHRVRAAAERHVPGIAARHDHVEEETLLVRHRLADGQVRLQRVVIVEGMRRLHDADLGVGEETDGAHQEIALRHEICVENGDELAARYTRSHATRCDRARRRIASHGRNDARNPVLDYALLMAALSAATHEPRIDRPADGVTYDPTRPGIEDRGQVHEASRDCDMGDVGHPELVGTIRRHVVREVSEDRIIVIAIRRRDKTPAPPWILARARA